MKKTNRNASSESKRFNPVTTDVSFPEMESKLLEKWYSEGIVSKYLTRNKTSDKRFSFLDGPITANNPMGVHHAWGRTNKDLWQRYFNMRGYAGRFQNGFDCQGLWVEVEVEKELKVRTKKDIENLVPGDPTASVARFVELCKARVLKFSGIQTEQSKRLGYFMDWDNSYFTMSDENNYMIWHFLKVCHEKGWMYKGRASVPWCPRCETAISQHEMLTEDYKVVSHKAIYLELPVVGRDEYLLVWTTTPWTIPANIAVAVDTDMEYSLVEGATGYLYWIAKDAIERVFGTEYKRIVKTVKGADLVGVRYSGPFDTLPAVRDVARKNPDTFHTVVPTDKTILPITAGEGTGLVHTAVSAGVEDFALGKKLGLPMIPVIADNADYLQGLDFLSGKNAKKHPELILDHLSERDGKNGEQWVFKIENYTHRYPACWRCKTELVWKVADEWYIAMDVPEKTDNGAGMTLREQMKKTAGMIDWHPEFGLARELDWLSNMHDWLISKKNRYWGLALPIYECASCGAFEVLGSKDELKTRAVSGWESFEGHTPHKPYIDEVKIACSSCGKPVRRINDVGNVWLDAGIVPFSTFVDPVTRKLSYTSDKTYWQNWFPIDFITESFPGQFKNWFYSMIAMSTVLEKRNPFKTVLGYGSVMGEDGRPMHKSWGNSIEFNEAANSIGADVMRWMFATHDPEQNILFGYKRADETRRRFHLLLWNTYNFFLTYRQVDGWEPGKGNAVESGHPLDRWLRSKLDDLTGTVTESLARYDAMTAARNIESFVTDFSQWYVRRSRSRIGPSAGSETDRDSCYATMYDALVTLSKLMAPFTPFLSETIYTNMTGEESVHLADWPEAGTARIDRDLERDMDTVRKIVELAHAKRKTAGIKVRQPLAKVTVITQTELPAGLSELIAAEVNVKKVMYAPAAKRGQGDEPSVELDTEVSDELKMEGEARDLIRSIQVLRKERGLSVSDTVDITLPERYRTLPEPLIQYIRKETLAGNIVWGSSLDIQIG
jgi:isoleucyl-tRNA synthetase